eukprot:TRINITY_DN16445_c0_g1_i1.p1 TRINITY_DN16445_c0_g1~~TRINITY_DN16445_c0_g1_i1.p1  ORF type:complete len:226 (-),score=67.07 TRINITY_DN16445_c0_g1_i1:202-879(-)
MDENSFLLLSERINNLEKKILPQNNEENNIKLIDDNIVPVTNRIGSILEKINQIKHGNPGINKMLKDENQIKLDVIENLAMKHVLSRTQTPGENNNNNEENNETNTSKTNNTKQKENIPYEVKVELITNLQENILMEKQLLSEIKTLKNFINKKLMNEEEIHYDDDNELYRNLELKLITLDKNKNKYSNEVVALVDKYNQFINYLTKFFQQVNEKLDNLEQKQNQ